MESGSNAFFLKRNVQKHLLYPCLCFVHSISIHFCILCMYVRIQRSSRTPTTQTKSGFGEDRWWKTHEDSHTIQTFHRQPSPCLNNNLEMHKTLQTATEYTHFISLSLQHTYCSNAIQGSPLQYSLTKQTFQREQGITSIVFFSILRGKFFHTVSRKGHSADETFSFRQFHSSLRNLKTNMSNRMKKKQTYVKKHEFLHTYTSEVNDNSAYILEISISKITPKSSHSYLYK